MRSPPGHREGHYTVCLLTAWQSRFSDDVLTLFTEGVQASQEKAETGKAGLWRACAETRERKPCHLFSGTEMDSASMQP